MSDEAERKILDMVEGGDITAEEGLRLMNAMSRSSHLAPIPADDDDISHEDIILNPAGAEEKGSTGIPKEELKRMKKIKRWWFLPFGIGLLVTVLGAYWMYSSFMAKGFGVGFWLAWIPFIAGIFLVAISFQTSYSVWLHVRIHQKPGETPQRIAISLPLPLSLTRWFLTTFGKRIPGLKDQPVDDYAEILKNLSPEEPFYVHVNDEDGEEVEVFIG